MSSRTVGTVHGFGVGDGKQVLKARMTVPVAPGHDDVLKIGARPDQVGEFGKQLFGHDQQPCPAVIEHESVVVRGEQRIDRHRHDSGLDRTEECGGPINAVEQTDQDAFLAADAERAQHIGKFVDARCQIAIGPTLALIDISELAGAAGFEIALEDVGGEIVVARDRIGGHARRQVRLSDIHRGVSSAGKP